jgi:hypothetical protein
VKTPIPIALALEDELSEQLLRRVLSERRHCYEVGPVFGKGGSGYLKKRCHAFNNMARSQPILLLTDLDLAACAPSLRAQWLSQPCHAQFLFRVAVREVEAWLLAADHELRNFLSVRRKWTVAAPESLSDPKAELLKIAAESKKRELRESLVRIESGNLRQGPAYNSTLARFIGGAWSPDVAEAKCPSFKRLLKALSSLETSWK